MSGSPTDLPRRLLAGEATDFERRVLETALGKKPSAASSARMARSLGVAVTTAGMVAAAKPLVAEASIAKAAASAGTAAVWPWVSAALLGVVVAGALVGTGSWRASPAALVTPPPSLTATPSAEPATDVVTDPPIGEEPLDRSRAHERSRVAPNTEDLRDQILVIDAARRAASAGSDARALRIVRRYLARYVDGSFRPEAAALEIEALVKLGRQREARELGIRFVAEHRGTLLAIRVGTLLDIPVQ